MGYPNTSAQDIAALQSQIDAFRNLVKDYYAEAVVYANMEHPAPPQEVEYLQRQLDLIRRAEDLMPELLEDEDSNEFPGNEEAHEWAADHQE